MSESPSEPHPSRRRLLAKLGGKTGKTLAAVGSYLTASGSLRYLFGGLIAVEIGLIVLLVAGAAVTVLMLTFFGRREAPHERLMELMYVITRQTRG